MRVKLMWISAKIEYIFVLYDYENFTNMCQIFLPEIFQIFNEEPYIEFPVDTMTYELLSMRKYQ
ncbi:hypothetical protein BGS1_18335 [Clostridium beijerinckii]|nr:hypothetical protein BGS1_18335 [Clostridium beijerinckii]